MRITKDRLSQIILEEASKMDGSEQDSSSDLSPPPDIGLDEGVFGGGQDDLRPFFNKMIEWIEYFKARDAQIKTEFSRLFREVSKISDRLSSAPEFKEESGEGSGEVTTTQYEDIPRVGKARKYDI